MTTTMTNQADDRRVLHYEPYVGWWLTTPDAQGHMHYPWNHAVRLTDADAQRARERGVPIDDNNRGR